MAHVIGAALNDGAPSASSLSSSVPSPVVVPVVSHHNLSAVCLTEAQMEMARGDFERYLQRYFFPCVAVFGILGNLLNLTVLLKRQMRSRANNFLSLLAIADICFLVLLLPNVLANYGIFAFNYYFRYFYLHSKVHLLSLANWSSAVAIWCVIAVCADRLIGIRHPLYVRAHFATYKMSLIMIAIVLLPGVFTLYQHFAYKCIVRMYCHGTQLYSKCLPINLERWPGNLTNPYSSSFRQFIDVSILLNIVLIIICPIIILATLNVMLLCALRRRATNSLLFGGSANSDDLQQHYNSNGTTSANVKHHKTEQRVTLTVTLIVTMFTLTNGPSAIVHLLQTLFQSSGSLRDWYDITLVCSTLVIIGKASNFILFCFSSKHFRKRIFDLARKNVLEKLDSRRKSSTGLGQVSFGIASRKNIATSMKKHSFVTR